MNSGHPWCRRISCAGLSLVLAILLTLTTAKPSLALDVASYFDISYNTTFSKSELRPGEKTQATITGQATCTNDLPLSVSEAYVTGRIVAQHAISGNRIILYPSYTVSLSSFPRKKGESVQASRTLELSFPEGAELGQYNIIGELIEARVKAVLWFSVTAYLPATETFGTLTVVPVPSPSIPTVPPGTTIISGRIDSKGIVLEDISALSADGRCGLILTKGITALDSYGQPLQEIRLTPMNEPPATPQNLTAIGLNYDLQPEGASFDPPISITLRYDRSQIPPEVNEKDLFIAFWNKTTGQWQALLNCVVDTQAQTITAAISHFSAYGIMARTAPASFTLSNLTISPANAETGQPISITATIGNSGDLAGVYKLILSIDYQAQETREITLPGKTSQKVSFNLSLNKAGSYTVGLNGMSGTLTIRETMVSNTATVTPSIEPGQTPKASKTETAALIPVVSEPPEQTLAPNNSNTQPAMTTPQPANRHINWWLAAGVSGAMIASITLIIIWSYRQRAKSRTEVITLEIQD